MSSHSSVTRWESLVSETQFATEQTIAGVKELALVANPGRFLFASDGSSVRHKLHNGLLQYTTGLERLAKLTLAIDAYYRSHTYPSVRSFGHNISSLLDKVAEIDTHGYTYTKLIIEERPCAPDDLLSVLTSYAQGGGRYEFLDSLQKPESEPLLYQQWTALAAEYTAPAWMLELIKFPKIAASVLQDVSSWVDSDLEVVLQPFMDSLNADYDESSVCIALNCMSLARWVASRLSALAHNSFFDASDPSRQVVFPYLSEILDKVFLHTDQALLEFYVFPFEDYEVVGEALRSLSALASEDDYDDSQGL